MHLIAFIFLLFIMVLRYFIFSGFFYYLSLRLKKTQPALFKDVDIKNSIKSSIVFAGVGVFFFYIIQAGFSKMSFKDLPYPIWYEGLSLALFFLLQDAYFYWTHRLMHLVSFKKCHYAHHESKHPSAWTSFAFHPLEALIQAIFLPAFIMIIPIHVVTFFVGLAVMSFFGVTNHLGYEIYPTFLEKKLRIITANHHSVHHKQYNKNFGLFFTFWDRWMKTE